MFEIDELSNDILKTAGFASGVKNFGKAIHRTAGGALLGGAMGGLKGVSANEKNPYASQSEKEKNILAGAASGALLGGAISGPGVGAVKKVGKGVASIFKKSEMECPNDDEKGVNETEKDREVIESPNDEEKRRMANSIDVDDEKKQHYKDKIEKEASSILSDWRWK